MRSSTSTPLAMSSGAVYSFGEWLIPPLLGTKIMPIGATCDMSCASWPAPLGIDRTVSPSDLAASVMIRRTRSSVGAGDSATSISAKLIGVCRASAIRCACAAIAWKTSSILSAARSRISRLIVTRPGMTLGAPGSARMRPTVATCRPGNEVAIRLTASVNSAALSSASRRRSMGVVPA
ncbi:MAG: hypothetical protein WD793_09880 [Steroidobacteraceae bacterium]